MINKKTYHILLPLLLSILYAAPSHSQNNCYIQMHDASGYDTSPYQSDLEAKACELLAAFPDSVYADSFKVYSFGFYVNLAYYDAYSYPQAFLDMKAEVAGMSPYYFLIGRQSDPEGVFTKFWVDVKLPEGGSFNTECLDETDRILFTNRIGVGVNQKYKQLDKDPSRYYEAELWGMDTLISFIEKVIVCCDPEMRTSCDFFSSNSSAILEYYLGLGFDIFQLKVVGQSEESVAEENEIADFAKVLVEFEGDTLNLAEVFLEGISSTFLDSLNVKGLFTKDEDIGNGNFLTANYIWENETFDFIQWVHYSEILAPDGNAYVMMAIKGNMFNVTFTIPSTIEVYFVPPAPEVTQWFDFTMDLEKVKLEILNIYQNKNNIDHINISLSDKEILELHDLWITIVYEPQFVGLGGNTQVKSPPITRKPKETPPYPGTFVNFAYIKGTAGSASNITNYYHYRIGYIASHELLHQILIKAYYYLCTNGQIEGESGCYDNPFNCNCHINSTINLLTEGAKTWGNLPKSKTEELIDEETILMKHKKIIGYYLTLRNYEEYYSSNHIHFIGLARAIKKYFLDVTNFYSG